MVFCGDTLFACGCGRVFEGTPEQMHASLARLAALPDHTQVYCAHEYTLSNIGFARTVEPGNEALARREADDRALRAAGRPTVPTTIGREKATNPFLRCGEPAVIASADTFRGSPAAGPVQVFAALREWKNRM
jgi:hydroxyacylglutathione hydrolase